MKVRLIAYTPNPDRLCGIAAMASYKPESISKNMDELSNEEACKILKNVIGFGHHSVIEHASFTFAIEGVSRALTHQLVRHRIASYTQQSQRYVKLDEPGYVTPPEIEKNVDAKRVFVNAMEQAWKTYRELLEMGIQKEDARFVLPNATHTQIVVTMNARELLHFFKLRCCERSQWELRQLATEMLCLVKRVAPVIFENAGPSCMQGFCPEKELKPKKCDIAEIKERFKNM